MKKQNHLQSLIDWSKNLKEVIEKKPLVAPDGYEIAFKQFDNDIKTEIQKLEKDFYQLKKQYPEIWYSNYNGEDAVIPAEQMLEEIQELRKKEKPYSVYTGIDVIDEMIGGFRPGNLVVISAPTGSGKTTFAQTITKNMVRKEDKGQKPYPLWFTYEVTAEDFLERFPNESLIFTMPRKLKDNSISWLRERIFESILKYQTRIVFIDHLHFLMNMETLGNRNVSLEVGTIMRQLKQMALEYKITIVLIAHLKKTQIEDTPNLDDIRDSSFIAQESDVVIILWRKTVEKSKRDLRDSGLEYTNQSVVSVQKNRRTGKLGSVILQMGKDNFFYQLENKYE